MSSSDTGDQQIPLAQRILALQMKNRKKLHMYEASRTSQTIEGEGNKENSILSTSITTRQNKTAPPGQMFDMSKINDSLASAPHNKSSTVSTEREATHTSLDKIRRPPAPLSKSNQLSAIAERNAEREHSGNRSRPTECDNRSAMEAQLKSRSKSVGSKESRSRRDGIPQSTSGMRPSNSTSSLQNKYISINGHSYLWLSLLGKGGSSRVYEVFDEAQGESCALKVVDLGDDPSVRQCYLNEIELLKNLQGSPYVIKILEYELREEENTLYVLMEKGEIDLATFLRTQRTKIDAVFINYHWKELLRCVKVIHDRKIVHSDLKPANFLFVKGAVKLIDFGIAAGIPNDMTAAIKESQMGTLSYMAPEILQGGSGDGKFKIPLKADVWSLGCILYNMVYGRLPFTMKSQAAKMAAICNPDYVIDFPNCGNALLVDVLKRCLVRDVRQRADVNELLEHPYLTGQRSSPASGDSLDASQCGPKLDYLAIAKELQNNTPNTMARRLEELTRGQASNSSDARGDSKLRKVLDFSQ